MDRVHSIHGEPEIGAETPASASTPSPTLRRVLKTEAALEGCREALAKMEFVIGVAGVALLIFRTGYETGQRDLG